MGTSDDAEGCKKEEDMPVLPPSSSSSSSSSSSFVGAPPPPTEDTHRQPHSKESTDSKPSTEGENGPNAAATATSAEAFAPTMTAAASASSSTAPLPPPSRKDNHHPHQHHHHHHHHHTQRSCERTMIGMMNRTLLDPPRWGWTASGGVVDVLPPHERARRKAAKKAFLKYKRQRDLEIRVHRTSTTNTTSAPSIAKSAINDDSQQQQQQRQQQQQQKTQGVESKLNGVYADSNAPDAVPVNSSQTTQDGENNTTTTAAVTYLCDPLKLPPGTAAATAVGASSAAAPGVTVAAEGMPPTADGAPTTALPETTCSEGKRDNPQQAQEAQQLDDMQSQSTRTNSKDRKSSKKGTGSKKNSGRSARTQEVQSSAAGASSDAGGNQQQKDDLRSIRFSALLDQYRPRAEKEGTRTVSEGASSDHVVDEAVGGKDTNAAVDDANADGVDRVQQQPKDTSEERERQQPQQQPDQPQQQHRWRCLDVHTYHRGREGVELRDEQTGELLCDVPEPTDTNFGLDEPRMVAQITIQFPLEDDDGAVDSVAAAPDVPAAATNGGANDAAASAATSTAIQPETRCYKETLAWDLSDPETLTPMEYAVNVGENFGLSFAQTMEICESIRQQLLAFVRENCSYAAPLATKDPSTKQPINDERLPPACAHALFGDTTGLIRGGTRLLPLRRSGATGPASTARVLAARGLTSGTGRIEKDSRYVRGKAPGKHKQRRIKSSANPGELPVQKRGGVMSIDMNQKYMQVGDDWCEEVKNRLLAESRRKIHCGETRASCDDGDEFDTELVGFLPAIHRGVCHICRKNTSKEQQKRRSFACGRAAHVYCEKHLLERLNLDANGHMPLQLDYCPICTITCTCSACVRKLHAIATHLKAKAYEQGTESSPADTKFDDLFEFATHKGAPPAVAAGVQLMSDPASLNSKSLSAPGKEKAKGKSKKGQSSPAKTNKSQEKSSLSVAIGDKDINGKRRKSDTASNGDSASMSPKNKRRKVDLTISQGGSKKSQVIRRRVFSPARTVAKVSLKEFPREVCEGYDIDPATEAEYNALYGIDEMNAQSVVTMNGYNDRKSSLSTNVNQDEDSSMDQCIECNEIGSLVCCNFCPRAYHIDCVDKAHRNFDEGDRWKCPRCLREEEGLPGDVVDVKNFLDVISNKYGSAHAAPQAEVDPSLRILSIICAMLSALMRYDFGFVFRQAVDTIKNPWYTRVVKRPMDLGAINSKLVKGEYNEGNEFDTIIANVLKDIELVWHNCFIANPPTSAIYGMAEVQRNCAQRILKQNLDSLLSDTVKQEVHDFVSCCEKERIEKAHGNNAVCPKFLQAQSRYKISVSPKSQNVKTKAIAVLDPSSGKLVKAYRRVQTALDVVHLFSSLNHLCEWDLESNDHNWKLRRIVSESSNDSSLTLFGYRWLMLDDLRRNRVAFCNPEAESAHKSQSPAKKLPEDFLKATSQEESHVDDNCEDLTDLDHAYRNRSMSIEQEDEESVTLHPMLMGKSPSMGIKDWNRRHQFYNATASDMILKENLVGGNLLRGFKSLKDAYDDWVAEIKTNPSEKDVARTMETFRTYYLDGERNVNCLAWKSNPSFGGGHEEAEERPQAPLFGGKTPRFATTNEMPPSPTSTEDCTTGLSASRNSELLTDLVSPLVSQRNVA